MTAYLNGNASDTRLSLGKIKIKIKMQASCHPHSNPRPVHEMKKWHDLNIYYKC